MRADDSPRHVSPLLKAAEQDSSDSSLSDDGLADLDSIASIEEVPNPTSSSPSAAEPIEKTNGEESVPYARLSNAVIQQEPAPPRRPQLEHKLTSVACSPDQHPTLKTRKTNHGPTKNGTTGQGRQAQADDDSPPRLRSNSEHRQSQAPLTVLRKRLRSSKLAHKIVKHKRSQRLFPSKGQPSIGDGFEKSELHVGYRIVSHRRRKPFRRDAIVYKQLPIAGGPLPDVMFECSADELNAEESGGLHHVTTRLPSSSTPGGPNAQLSSIKAPPRPRGDPDDDDAEDSADDDEEVESETSKDEEEVVFQTVDPANRIDDELLVDYVESSSTRQELTPSEQPALRFKNSHMERENAVYSSDDEELEGAIEAPGRSRRRSIERMRLMEAEEPIDDFPDTMHAERMSAAVANHYARSTEGRTRRKIQISLGVLETEADRPAGQPRLHRLRSILKSNTPLMPDITYRPDDLEGNTRRNSRHAVNVEDSRYFSQASEILRNPDISNHQILPRRTRSKHFSREDEEQVEGYHDGQLRESRQDAEFGRDPQSSSKPESDLKSLTRQVSRANGTMSRSVRRRSTLGFESPFKIPPIR
ncbi:hypothetical protein KC331_g13720 [Hortaea werneckii]|nr:hypothetical protein KC331_g13720 [Hortaea werneckii]